MYTQQEVSTDHGTETSSVATRFLVMRQGGHLRDRSSAFHCTIAELLAFSHPADMAQLAMVYGQENVNSAKSY